MKGLHGKCSLQECFNSTAVVFLRRRKGARALLIVRSCCVLFLRHREGVDVLQPKRLVCELFSTACMIPLSRLRRECGFCLCSSGDRVSWILCVVFGAWPAFLLDVFVTVFLERSEHDGLE